MPRAGTTNTSAPRTQRTSPSTAGPCTSSAPRARPASPYHHATGPDREPGQHRALRLRRLFSDFTGDHLSAASALGRWTRPSSASWRARRAASRSAWRARTRRLRRVVAGAPVQRPDRTLRAWVLPAERAADAPVLPPLPAGQDSPDSVWQISEHDDSPDVIERIFLSAEHWTRRGALFSAPLVALCPVDVRRERLRPLLL